MNLQQLRYLKEVVNRGMGISDAARALNTSQPGVSKQLRKLEEELGVDIFVRARHRVIDLTAVGVELLELARTAVTAADSITDLSRSHKREKVRTLRIAATHAQARVFLPSVLAQLKSHNKIAVVVNHGTPAEVVEAVRSGDANLGITPEPSKASSNLTLIRCATHPRVLIVPFGHPLVGKRLSLSAIGAFPIITSQPGSPSWSEITRAFSAAGSKPNISLCATDTEVMKECTKFGLGITVLPSYCFDKSKDIGMTSIDVSKLFGTSSTVIVLRVDRGGASGTSEFVQLFLRNCITQSAVDIRKMSKRTIDSRRSS